MQSAVSVFNKFVNRQELCRKMSKRGLYILYLDRVVYLDRQGWRTNHHISRRNTAAPPGMVGALVAIWQTAYMSLLGKHLRTDLQNRTKKTAR